MTNIMSTLSAGDIARLAAERKASAAGAGTNVPNFYSARLSPLVARVGDNAGSWSRHHPPLNAKCIIKSEQSRYIPLYHMCCHALVGV